MTRLGLEAVAAYARGAGLADPEAIATACAIAGWNGSPNPGESGGDPSARGDTTITTDKWGPSIGLWQVRSLRGEYGTGGSRDESRLSDPTFNARSMYEISSGGTNWQPWSVYTKGTYRQNMDAARKGLGIDSGGVNLGIDLPDLPSIPNPIGGVTDAAGQLADVAGMLADPAWWRRVGLGVLGLVLLVVGGMMVARDTLAAEAIGSIRKAAT